MSGFNLLSIILIINSITLISLVLTQNDTSKDTLIQNSSRTNPIELIIWISMILEIILLLVFGKITDF